MNKPFIEYTKATRKLQLSEFRVALVFMFILGEIVDKVDFN